MSEEPTGYGTVDDDDFLMAGGGVSCQFPKKGDSYTGTIVKSGRARPQTDPESGDVKTFKSGDVRQTKPVTLVCENPKGRWDKDAMEYTDIEDDNGERVLWVQGSMKNAVRDAILKAFKESGVKSKPGLELGGLLTVTYSSSIPSGKKGVNPTKVYTAEYVLAKDNKANAHLLEEDDPFDDED
jgi:hypothetical protein